MPVNITQRVADSNDKPHVRIVSLEFENGLSLKMKPHETIVVVGPNNAGKSLLLREVQGLLQQGPLRQQTHLLRDVHLETDSGVNEVLQWAISSTPAHLRAIGPAHDRPVVLPSQRLSDQAVTSLWGTGVSGNGFGVLTPLFCGYLNTEGRLALAQNVNSFNPVDDSPSHPMHHLHEDDDIEIRISRLVERAFGQELVVNRSAGPVIQLHLGKRPAPPEGKDRLSKDFRTAVHSLPQVINQGDGVKAYVGILLQTLVINREITLIDEPEAFLHPPQATLLGKSLATELQRPRQLIVATHSSDFLRGMLDAPDAAVRVLRLRRTAGETVVAELDAGAVRDVWQDTLLRYSGVFDGLFHDGVIVCEGDADCRFYSAMMDAVAGDLKRPDLLLVHGAGKSRVPAIVRALQAIQVPVRAVFDIDVLSEEHTLKAAIAAMGGSWDNYSADWKTVKKAIESKRPELQTSDVASQIQEILSAERETTVSQRSFAEIRKVLQKASAWAEAKRSGKSFVPRGEQTVAYDRLAANLRSLGIFIVEVGEVEGFCPSIANHGPAWCVAALQRDLGTDPELEDARSFARELLQHW